jgi:hypothetical protein
MVHQAEVQRWHGAVAHPIAPMQLDGPLSLIDV